jgi:general secretion pathway protein G
MKRPVLSVKSTVALFAVLFSGIFLLGIRDIYQRSLKRSREAVSKQDLALMREAIKHYTSDKMRPPHSLQDLLDEQYLRKIPTDSLTGKKDWVPHFSNVTVGPGKTLFGIDDVRSNTTNSDGVPDDR